MKRPAKMNGKSCLRLLHIWVFTIVTVCAAHAAASPDSSSSDVLIFTNGESLTGRILSATKLAIEFESVALGKLTVPLARVRQATVSGSSLKLLNTGSEAESNHGEDRDAVLKVTSSGLLLVWGKHQIPVPEGSTLSFVDPAVNQASLPAAVSPDKPAQQKKNTATLGITFPESYVYGTQSQVNLGGDILFTANQTQHVCDAASWLTNLHLSGSHIRSWKVKSSAVTTNTYDATLTVKNAFSKNGPAAYYGIADLASNNSLGIGLQQSYGAGLSTIAYATDCAKTPPSRYRIITTVFGDIRYMHERLYAPATPLSLVGVRIGEDITYIALDKNKTERFSIAETMWVIPTLNDIHAVQAFGRLQFNLPITKSLSVGLTQEDDFLNNAPTGKRKHYSKSSITLRYSFPAP